MPAVRARFHIRIVAVGFLAIKPIVPSSLCRPLGWRRPIDMRIIVSVTIFVVIRVRIVRRVKGPEQTVVWPAAIPATVPIVIITVTVVSMVVTTATVVPMAVVAVTGITMAEMAVAVVTAISVMRSVVTNTAVISVTATTVMPTSDVSGLCKIGSNGKHERYGESRY